jgi:sensor histidine kinase YesM
MKPTWRRVARYTVISLVLATVFGLAEATQIKAGSVKWKNPLTWTRALTATMPSWYVLVALAPLVIFVARKFPLSTLKTPKSLAAHFVTAILFVMTHLALSGYISDYVLYENYPLKFPAQFLRLLSMYFVADITLYLGIVGGYFAYDYSQRYRQKERIEAELKSELATAQLDTLRSQLHPHFLFNTLNAVNALIHEDPNTANRILTRLAELLRVTLRAGPAQEVPLAQEMEFIRAYLEIQQVRLGDRLSVCYHIPDELSDAKVPALLLQPIVENAVIHGIGPLPRGGRIAIRAFRNEQTLTLTVQDSGVGMPTTVHSGIGLSNVAARLHYLYCDRHRLDITAADDGGTIVEIDIPLLH